MRKLVWLTLISCVVIGYFAYSISQNLKTQRNDVSISIIDPDVKPTSLSIAVIGDTHTPEGREPLATLRELLLEVKAAEPDLIVFVGDYIDQSTQQIIHIYPNNIISLCKEVPLPWNQYIPYEINNNTIYMIGAYGKLINNSEISIKWEGTFESTWNLISKENDYT